MASSRSLLAYCFLSSSHLPDMYSRHYDYYYYYSYYHSYSYSYYHSYSYSYSYSYSTTTTGSAHCCLSASRSGLSNGTRSQSPCISCMYPACACSRKYSHRSHTRPRACASMHEPCTNHARTMHGPQGLCLRALVTGDEHHLEALLVFVGHLVRGGQLGCETCGRGGTGEACAQDCAVAAWFERAAHRGRAGTSAQKTAGSRAGALQLARG